MSRSYHPRFPKLKLTSRQRRRARRLQRLVLRAILEFVGHPNTAATRLALEAKVRTVMQRHQHLTR